MKKRVVKKKASRGSPEALRALARSPRTQETPVRVDHDDELSAEVIVDEEGMIRPLVVGVDE